MILNKLIKVVLLLASVFSALIGVMFFYRTIVAPPGKLKFINYHIETAKNNISIINGADFNELQDIIYIRVLHKLDFLMNNKLISKQEYDELLKIFISQYIPAYVDECEDVFEGSVWVDKDIRNIDVRIAELRSMKIMENEALINTELMNSLDDVEIVAAYYGEAMRVATVSSFLGLDSAKLLIASASRYSNMYPLKNNIELKNRLSSVASKLEKIHYSYLVEQAARLEKYTLYDELEYKDFAHRVIDEVEEYENSAMAVYGSESDLDLLKSVIGYYLKGAVAYFEWDKIKDW